MEQRGVNQAILRFQSRGAWLVFAGLCLLAITASGATMRALRQEVGAGREPAAQPVEIPAATDEAIRFHRGGMIIWCLSQALYLSIPAIVLGTGWSPRMRELCRRMVRRRWLPTIGLYFVLYWTLVRLVRLPLAYYAGFVRLHEYGLSNQTPAKWASDWAIQLGIELVTGLVVVSVLYALISARPRWWWLDLSFLSIPAAVFVLWVVPVWIDPLFNDFGSMRDTELEQKILALADRAGISGSRVFEVRKSVDTPAINAYVTGMWGTKRIVLWDTILQRLDERQLLFVVAHEMGHYALHHALMGTLLLCGAVFVGARGIDITVRYLLARCRDRFGFSELRDIASLPLLVLLAHLAWLGVSPLANTASRYMEREADRFGLELTQDSVAAATAFVEMQHTNLAHPSPGWLHRVFRGTHPTTAARIEFCNGYRPWESDQKLRYGRFFQNSP